ncbi:hypothetical protein [Maribacter sp. 1_MG-2023]|uniref:hypothetical protein n=1 Tax=Maribacter sp. 1_MG-2023 TaxID=3062677 RepID=UPI0026E2148B|nr:hypothetical protein [Maribacter sp. 1_MG-2023]MDO6470143.1 hypothetical protein [Maribacter sp. 1_MG-2023]
MKNLTLILLVFSIMKFSYSQNLSGAPTGEAGLFDNAAGGNPMMNLVMMDLRNQPSSTANIKEEIMGSPYLTDKFIKSQVFYEDELQGTYFVRYNAMNSIIEIKDTNLEEEIAKKLYPDKNISVKYLNKTLRFITYINKKKETKNGYLSLILDKERFKLYHRLAVKYAEGKAAANSMVNAIPSRFAQFEEFYYKKQDIERIDYLPTSKNGILRIIDKDKKEQVKTYLKENSFNYSNEEDLITIFEYINSL